MDTKFWNISLLGLLIINLINTELIEFTLFHKSYLF
jgi:hypothetical protein